MAMRKAGYITILLTGFLATLLLGSCSTDDVAELPLEEGVPVVRREMQLFLSTGY